VLQVGRALVANAIVHTPAGTRVGTTPCSPSRTTVPGSRRSMRSGSLTASTGSRARRRRGAGSAWRSPASWPSGWAARSGSRSRRAGPRSR
jgi:hypothetical protein